MLLKRLMIIGLVKLCAVGCATQRTDATSAMYGANVVTQLPEAGAYRQNRDDTNARSEVRDRAYKANDSRPNHFKAPSGEQDGPLAPVIAAYQRFDYPATIQLGKKTIADPRATSEQKASAAVLTGAAQHLLGNDRLAMAYFRHAHRLLPGRSLSPEAFPERIRKLYESARGAR